MIQDLQGAKPLFGPLAAAIAPSARPFGFTPRVADFEEPFALVLHGTEDTVCMRADKACSDRQSIYSAHEERRGVPLVVVASVATPLPASESR